MTTGSAEAGSKKKKSAMAASAADDAAPLYPKMALAQQIHRLQLQQRRSEGGNVLPQYAQLEIDVFDQIAVELQNPGLYRIVKEKLYDGLEPLQAAAKLTPDDLQKLENKNAQVAQDLQKKIETAIESAGDMEVMDARSEYARFAAQSLSQTEAVTAYEQLVSTPKVSSGKKIDAWMACARIASFYGDTVAADEAIQKAHELAEAGGGADWDRRNRLKVYRALQKLLHRDLEGAAGLLLDGIATFSCTEICTYTEFIVYAILTNLLYLPRPQLKKKIIDGPEILSVAPEIPVVIKLVRSFYDCDYKKYLQAMIETEQILLEDRYLHPHVHHWMRELHILAYKQFLDSYQSVTLQAMADAFGVSTEFIDHHASRYIAANRLSAKIDKYGGVIVTNRPDLKNGQYREMIQKGDLLLNRIQKLARVVDL